MAAPQPDTVIRIDQARIAAWIAANPNELRPGARAATYPRPLSWWREFAPEWVTVGEEPGGIITMTPASTGGGAAAQRRRDEAMAHWLRGIRPVAAAIIEDQGGRWGVWWHDGEGDRFADADGNISFDHTTACQIAQRTGGGIRRLGTAPAGYPKVRHRTIDAATCRYQVLVQESPGQPWRVLGVVQRFGSLPSLRGWKALGDAAGAEWTRKRQTRGEASADMVTAWQARN